MSNDYSTPTPADSSADESISTEMPEWVKGNLPDTPLVESQPVEEKKPARRKKKDKAPAPEKELPPETPAPEAEVPTPAAPIAGPPVATPAEISPDDLGLEALLEGLLFVADGPVPVTQLAEALEVTVRQVEATLTALTTFYATHKRGLSLQRFRDKVQLTSTPAAGERITRFLGLAAMQPLTRASLETLAIIAYQQPITRPQIDQLRGVNSDSVIKNLLGKGLIEEGGRTEGPGRPVLYTTTPEFLQYFGLTALTDLPALNLEQLAALAKADVENATPAEGEPTQDFLKG